MLLLLLMLPQFTYRRKHQQQQQQQSVPVTKGELLPTVPEVVQGKELKLDESFIEDDNLNEDGSHFYDDVPFENIREGLTDDPEKLKLNFATVQSQDMAWETVKDLYSIPYPVKNVIWFLMEIPCHFSSQLDLVAVWSKSTQNSMTIPCHLSRIYPFSMLKHDMDFGQVQVIEFSWHLLRK